MAVRLSSLDRSRGAAILFSKQLLNYPDEVQWTPFQAHYFSDLVAPVIEPGTSESVVRAL
jgi:hypothetical protein